MIRYVHVADIFTGYLVYFHNDTPYIDEVHTLYESTFWKHMHVNGISGCYAEPSHPCPVSVTYLEVLRKCVTTLVHIGSISVGIWLMFSMSSPINSLTGTLSIVITLVACPYIDPDFWGSFKESHSGKK